MRPIDADAMIGALHNHAFLEGDDRAIVYNVIQKQPTVAFEWISVKDRLPEQSCEVLCLFEDLTIGKLMYDDCIDEPEKRFGYWEQYYNQTSLGWEGEDWVPIESTTHWMPIPDYPEPPAEEEDE